MSYPTALETLRGLLVTLSGLPNDRVLLWGTAQVTRRPPVSGQPAAQITLTVLDDAMTGRPYRVGDDVEVHRLLTVQVDALGVDGCSTLRRAHLLLWPASEGLASTLGLQRVDPLRDTSALETTAYAPRLTCTVELGYVDRAAYAPGPLATAIILTVDPPGSGVDEIDPVATIPIP